MSALNNQDSNTPNFTITDEKQQNTNKEVVGWVGKCPEYLWDYVKEYYDVAESEQLASLFLLAEHKREEYIRNRDEMSKKVMDYGTQLWKASKNENLSQKVDANDCQLLRELQNIDYESRDLFNVIIHPLRTLIEHCYNEMENIYKKDLKEFENEKIIKQQMYEKIKTLKKNKPKQNKHNEHNEQNHEINAFPQQIKNTKSTTNTNQNKTSKTKTKTKTKSKNKNKNKRKKQQKHK